MELLLFIYALECGMIGTPQNEVEPVVYVQTEAGIQIDELSIVGIYYSEIDLSGGQPENPEVIIQLSVETDSFVFGGSFSYELTTGNDLFSIYGRIQGSN